MEKTFNMWTEIDTLGIIQVTGIDAARFLQGQLTCDLTKINSHTSSLGAHCNPKGRIIFSFRILQITETHYYLILPQTMIDLALHALKKYAVFFKVKLENISRDHRIFGLAEYASANSESTLINQVVIADNIIFIQIAACSSRTLVVTPADDWLSLRQKRGLFASPSPASLWDYMDISAGIASIYPETTEIFTPHNINYHQIGAVSFKKGCYTGQEVIARMQHLGTLKQHLYHGITNSTVIPPLGSSIFLDEKEVGTIVNAAFDESHKVHFLASIQDHAIQTNNLLLADNTRVCLDFARLRQKGTDF